MVHTEVSYRETSVCETSHCCCLKEHEVTLWTESLFSVSMEADVAERVHSYSPNGLEK